MPRDLPLPSNLGRYRLLSKLGEGGMGTVYLAEDTELGRRVALKVPHFGEDDGEEIIKRFQREARLAAGVSHVNLCPVYDVGHVEGVHYLSMPYVEGTPLSRLVGHEWPWDPEKALVLTRKLALATQVMHDKGVVHRDLKPSNVILRSDGEPILMDFGLARSFTAQGRGITRTGALVGTPAYMAPEQVLGETRKIGPPTDIYSLGVILFELLTGQVPFEGPLAAIYGQILHAPPEAPSVRRTELDAQLDAICLKAMAKQPQERFASMSDFAAALEACLRRQVPAPSPVAAGTAAPSVATPEASGVATPVRLTCPRCGKVVKTPPTGKKAKCLYCETLVDVPSEKQTLPNPAGAGRKPLTGTSPAGRGAQVSRPARDDADLPEVTAAEEPSPFGKKQMVLVGWATLFSVAVGLTAWLLLRGRSDQTPPGADDPASLRLVPIVQGGRLDLWPGATTILEVRLVRRNCPGKIEVYPAAPTPGVTIRAGTVAAGVDSVTLIVEVDSSAPPGDRDIRLLAVGDRVRGEGAVRLTIAPGSRSLTLDPPAPVTLMPGESRTIALHMRRRNCSEHVEVQLVLPAFGVPSGITLHNGKVPAGTEDGSLELRVEKNAPSGPQMLRLRASGGGLSAETTLQLTIEIREPPAVVGPLRQRPEVLVPDEFQVAVLRGQFPILQLTTEKAGNQGAIRNVWVTDGADVRGPGGAGPGGGVVLGGRAPGGGLSDDLLSLLRKTPPFAAPGARDLRDLGAALEPFTRQQGPFSSAGRNKLQEVPLSKASGRMPVYGVVPTRMAVVAASFPFKRQVEEFRRKLHLPDHNAVFSEQVRGEEGKSWPSFQFDGLEVERMTLREDGSDGRWQPLDLRSDYLKFALLTSRSLVADDSFYGSPVVAAGRGLVMRVPAPFPPGGQAAEGGLMMGPMGGDSPAFFPDLVRRLEKIRQTLEELNKSEGSGMLPTQGPRTEFDPFDPHGNDGPISAPPPSRPIGPTSPPGGIPGPGTPTKSSDTPITYCLLRFVDLDVEAGKSYRYRLRVRMMNPNFAPEPDKRKDTTPEQARDKGLKSDWARVPQTVTVPPDQVVYALDLPDGGYPLNTAMKKWEPWRWTFVGPQGYPPPQESSQAAVQIHRWVDSYLADPADEKTRRTVGEWLVAARVLVQRGEYVRDPEYRVLVPVKPLDASGHDLDTNPKAKLGKDKHLMSVDFGDKSLLIDFDGGQQRYNKTEGSGATMRTEVVSDRSAVELLIMRPDGKMIARNTADDGEDKERSARVQVFLERIEKLRYSGRGKPGFPGSPFDKLDR
ncbi:MAG: protein kinase [Planctomycetes bacterium]|nr:protein kinase [Planctomycetota bacterium]